MSKLLKYKASQSVRTTHKRPPHLPNSTPPPHPTGVTTSYNLNPKHLPPLPPPSPVRARPTRALPPPPLASYLASWPARPRARAREPDHVSISLLARGLFSSCCLSVCLSAPLRPGRLHTNI
jgi:hypothetical protein